MVTVYTPRLRALMPRLGGLSWDVCVCACIHHVYMYVNICIVYTYIYIYMMILYMICLYIMMYTICVYYYLLNMCMSIYIYTYIYIGIVWLRDPNDSRPIHSGWTQTLLGGVWNVHNFCETCTSSAKREQLLRRILWQVLKHCSESDYTVPIYIYTYMHVYIYI